jgi:hypothetical protein
MARRAFSTFNMSFLDCMSCGFGAILLVFLVISAQITAQTDAQVTDLQGETLLMELKVAGARGHLGALNERLAELDRASAAASAAATVSKSAASTSAEQLQALEEEIRGREQSLESVKDELKALAARRAEEVEEARQDSARVRRAGQGQRQYLTGLRIGGRRVLILLDTSASMLARDIVNIIRLRNMQDSMKRRAPKWQQAVGTVEWLSARLPGDSRFQIYGFDVEAQSLVPGTQGEWLPVSGGRHLERAIDQLRELAPGGGTSLRAAFDAASALDPKPDNIYLVVDGLPTQSGSPAKGGTVSGNQRLKLFNRALRSLPPGVPVNVILLPMEGDPDAVTAYWRLARSTSGSLMSPSADWP